MNAGWSSLQLCLDRNETRKALEMEEPKLYRVGGVHDGSASACAPSRSTQLQLRRVHVPIDTYIARETQWHAAVSASHCAAHAAATVHQSQQ
jgi:hypothetical protein